MKLLTTIGLLSLLIVSGCGEKADPALVSQNRVNGKDIAQFNAGEYSRAMFPTLDTFVAGDIDSFVSAECPQGDGYASFVVKDKKDGRILAKLQCRTWEATGCFLEDQAGTKGKYMKNRCNPEVPTTIKKAS